ncbi:MAG TPA: hypothetical protein V6D29_21300 [Leptolyngbyaceae cyanobacterium]
MAQQRTGGRFSGLRALREERQQEEFINESDLEDQRESAEAKPAEAIPQPKANAKQPKKDEAKSETKADASDVPRRKPGRPPGRRSDPDYTQISAYIPLDLLLAVQDELALERRENRQRTARPVSDLVEELLSNWLKMRKTKNSKN